MSLWTSRNPQGPFKFKAYILDGGLHPGTWDAGRYSESRVWFHNGLFHLYMTASPVGNPHPNKNVEQIGWAVSQDGIHFVEHAANPIAPRTASTPHTLAMAEGHVWFDDARKLILVFHTLRWDDAKDRFAPDGRNAEDLGVEIFFTSPHFDVSFPIIDPARWKFSLGQDAESTPCAYDWKLGRYCTPLKTRIDGKGPHGEALSPVDPEISFSVRGHCASSAAAVVVAVDVFKYLYDSGVGAKLATLDVNGTCGSTGEFEGVTKPTSQFADDVWIVTKIAMKKAGGVLAHLAVDVSYKS